MTALVADLAGLLGCVVRGAQTWREFANFGWIFFLNKQLGKIHILKAKIAGFGRFNKIPFLKIVTGYSFWSYEASPEVFEWVEFPMCKDLQRNLGKLGVNFPKAHEVIWWTLCQFGPEQVSFEGSNSWPPAFSLLEKGGCLRQLGTTGTHHPHFILSRKTLSASFQKCQQFVSATFLRTSLFSV